MNLLKLALFIVKRKQFGFYGFMKCVLLFVCFFELLGFTQYFPNK